MSVMVISARVHQHEKEKRREEERDSRSLSTCTQEVGLVLSCRQWTEMVSLSFCFALALLVLAFERVSSSSCLLLQLHWKLPCQSMYATERLRLKQFTFAADYFCV